MAQPLWKKSCSCSFRFLGSVLRIEPAFFGFLQDCYFCSPSFSEDYCGWRRAGLAGSGSGFGLGYARSLRNETALAGGICLRLSGAKGCFGWSLALLLLKKKEVSEFKPKGSSDGFNKSQVF